MKQFSCGSVVPGCTARFTAETGRPLRPYQLAPARAILDSVLNRRGLTIAVMMSLPFAPNCSARACTTGMTMTPTCALLGEP